MDLVNEPLNILDHYHMPDNTDQLKIEPLFEEYSLPMQLKPSQISYKSQQLFEQKSLIPLVLS